jgi:hypothetical protein
VAGVAPDIKARQVVQLFENIGNTEFKHNSVKEILIGQRVLESTYEESKKTAKVNRRLKKKKRISSV